MDCRFNHRVTALLLTFCLFLGLSGCLSYEYTRRIDGVEIEAPGDQYSVGKTTIGDVLQNLGAPDDVFSLDNKDLLVYRRSVLQQNRLSIGIPVFDVATGGSIDMSASGALTRYDVLSFFFNPQGLLEDLVFEKGTDRPYFKTLF
jgi:hypothetical protein